MQRVLTGIILLACLVSTSFGRCMQFDIYSSFNEIDYIVYGKILESNRDRIIETCLKKNACNHSFGLKIDEVLKGDVEFERLKFKYPYSSRKPAIVTFNTDSKYVLAIKSIDDKGNAILLGHSCGRWGIKTLHPDVLKDAIKNTKWNNNKLKFSILKMLQFFSAYIYTKLQSIIFFR